MVASPPCAERPASAALIGRLGAPQRRAAPGSSGAERKRSLAASEHLAGLGGQMMWCDPIRAVGCSFGADLALKSGCRPRPCSLLRVCRRGSRGAEARRLTGERWVDVNMLSMGCAPLPVRRWWWWRWWWWWGWRGRERDWMLKIYCVSHDSFACAILATTPLCILGDMVDLKMI